MKNIDVIRNYIVENNEKFRENKIRKNSAITLIALVITIVVLLILAGVSLSVILGDNGILSKAKESKDKTEIAKYEEELETCVLDLQVEEAGTTFDMEVLRNKFVEKVKENENTDDIEIVSEEGNATIEGVYKGYEFTIDEKYVVHIGKKSTGIRAITELSPKGYTNQNVTATITIKCNNGISTIKQIIPTTEEISANGATEYVIRKENIEQNTKFEYEITDNQGNKTTKTIAITTIDKVPPKDFEITVEKIDGGLKINGTTTDEESGIARYEYYIKKSTDSEFIKKDTNEITGLSAGTYSVYAVAYDKAENFKESEPVNIDVKEPIKTTDISAQDIKNNPEGYYGKTVDYISENGQDNWKIFYSDGTYIFLITESCINTSEADRINLKSKIVSNGYSLYWNSDCSYQTVSQSILSRFKATGYPLSSSKQNANCTTTLLNVENWKKYLDQEDGTGKAEYAIGSPTIEMWIASWNELYKEEKLYWKPSSISYQPGYFLGTSMDSTSSAIKIDEKTGYNNKLYYPDIIEVDGYWVASPAANSVSYILFVYNNGTISGYYYGDDKAGIRPVVCLKSEETVDLKK